MKRFWMVMIAVLLLIPGLSLADQDILVTGSEQQYDNIRVLSRNCLYYKEGNIIWLYYELYNAGRNNLILDTNHSSVEFLDSRGNVYFDYPGSRFKTTDPSVTYTYLPFYPYYVAPGQKFYLRDMIFYLPNDDPEEAEAFQKILKASDYRLKIKLIQAYDTDYPIPLPASSTFRMVNVGYPAIELTMNVTNNTGKMVKDLRVIHIVRDQKGSPVIMESDNVYDVNIPAGSTKKVVFNTFDFNNLEFLDKYDFQIRDVEVVVYKYN